MDLIGYLNAAIGNLAARLNRIEEREVSPSTDTLVSNTFATLPSGFKSRVRWCSNCRKVGEGVGAGTGTPVYYNPATAAWNRWRDDTAAAI